MKTVDQDKALRPKDWDSYIGQDKVKERLNIQIEAARKRRDPLPHILLTGEPGTGKTSLSSIIASQMGMEFESIMVTPGLKPTVISRKILERESGVVLLLDEIHNLSKANQHYLYSVLEDNEISTDGGETVEIEVPLTIIGATTDPGLLSKAMFDRFDIKHRLEHYSDDEMTEIVKGMAKKSKVRLGMKAAEVLGKASAGTPRQARILVHTARDLGTSDTDAILDIAGITEDGLTEDHVDYLNSLYALGGQTGITNIVNHTGRPQEIVIEIEKLLVRRRFVELSRSGRVLMARGLKALNRINSEANS